MVPLKPCPCGRAANEPQRFSAFRGDHAAVRCCDELCLWRVTVRGDVELAALAWNAMVDAVVARGAPDHAPR